MSFDLAAFAANCHVAEPEAFAGQCEKLRQLLVEANQVTNLTRIVEPEEYAVKHVADSLSIGQFFPEFATDRLEIADIGCGAGFPSLVLALAYPKLRISAIDSTGKKTAFVESAARALDLTNLRVVTGRSRELNYRGEFKHRFDVVTARAVAAAALIVADARDFTNRHGRFILYKTPEQLKTDLPEVRALDKKNPLVWEVTPVFEVAPGVGERQFLYSVR